MVDAMTHLCTHCDDPATVQWRWITETRTERTCPNHVPGTDTHLPTMADNVQILQRDA